MYGTGVQGLGMGMRDEDGNEFFSLAPVPLETRITRSPLSKQTIENLQFWGFLGTAQVAGRAPALQRYERPPSDPPDITVTTVDGSALAVELTTLSTTQVTSQRLAEIRSIGRSLDDELSDLESYPHLRGRVVHLAEMGADEMRPPRRNPDQLKQLVSDLAAELKVDFGVVQPIPVRDFSAGPPERFTPEMSAIAARGRKSFEQYSIEVHDSGNPPAPPWVITNVGITIMMNELRDKVVQ